jgi:hypothetical protein
MKRQGRVCIVVGALAVGLLTGNATAQTLTEEVRVVALRWLLNDCGLSSSVAEDLRKIANPALEAFLIEALKQGPDAAQSAELEKAASQRYEQRTQTLQRGEVRGLSREDIEQALKVSRQDFLAREINDFVVRYKSQAVAGLGIIGSAKARTELQRLAGDEKSPLQTSAQEALIMLLRGK